MSKSGAWSAGVDVCSKGGEIEDTLENSSWPQNRKVRLTERAKVQPFRGSAEVLGSFNQGVIEIEAVNKKNNPILWQKKNPLGRNLGGASELSEPNWG